jgi:hypothetical protein
VYFGIADILKLESAQRLNVKDGTKLAQGHASFEAAQKAACPAYGRHVRG